MNEICASPAPVHSGHVVVVDDDAAVTRSMTLLLRAWGYSVDAYSNGLEVLSLRRLPFADCLLIDYKLPGIDGLDLFQRLKRDGLSAPAMLMTGFYSNSLASRARDLGFCDVLEKPAMNSILRELLVRYTPRQEN